MFSGAKTADRKESRGHETEGTSPTPPLGCDTGTQLSTPTPPTVWATAPFLLHSFNYVKFILIFIYVKKIAIVIFACFFLKKTINSVIGLNFYELGCKII